MPAPTLRGAPQQTTWSRGASPKALVLNVQAGDHIGVIALAENGGYPVTVASSGATVDAWASRSAQGSTSSQGYARCWSAQATSSGTLTVSLSCSGGFGAIAFVLDGATCDGYDSVGGMAASASAAAQWPHTTTAANCFLACGISDWNAVDLAGHTWATINGYTPVAGDGEDHAEAFAGIYTVFAAHWPDAGAAGTQTVGLASSGSSLRPAAVSLAFKGTAGAVTPHGSAAGTVATSGTASGTAPALPPASGSASGTVSTSSSAAGHTAHSGVATVNITTAGTGTGHAPTVGSHHGAASTAVAAATAATGHTVHRGAGSGSVAASGAAAGHAPALGVPHGTAATTVASSATGTGHVLRRGTADSTLTVTGTATGYAPNLVRRDLKVTATTPPASRWQTLAPLPSAWTPAEPATALTAAEPGHPLQTSEPAL